MKFTEKGEVVLSVYTEPAAEGRIALVFGVRDTGIGIPAEAMPRLFQSFSQVDASTTRRFGGTGLGLVISKRLVEIMGGRMWVESKVGRGLDLLVHPHGRGAPEQAAALPHGAGARPSWRDKRLLIVDDNATSRRILTTLGGGWGMSTHAAASNAEGARVAARRRFVRRRRARHADARDGRGDAGGRDHRLRGSAQLPLVLLSSLGHREHLGDPSLFSVCLTKPAKPSQLFLDALAEGALRPGAPRRRRPSSRRTSRRPPSPTPGTSWLPEKTTR